MEIAKGYKQTEVGVIPKDWQLKKLREVGRLITETINPQLSLDNSYYEYSMPSFDEGKSPILTLGRNMHSNRFIISAPVLLFNKLNVRQRRIWLVNECEPNSICSMEFLPFISSQLDLAFLRYYIDTDKITNYFIGLSKGTSNSQKRISPSDFLDLEIPFPPILEQKAIAKKLFEIDELIAGFGEQIEKKRQIKEGAMQQLLTGKTRLPGFTQPWREVQIGKIGYTYPGITGKSKDDFNRGDARYITFLNVLNNPVIDTSIFERVNISPTEGQNAVHKGDLFFNTSSETPEEVGICAVLNEEIEDLYLNSFCFGYRLTDDSILGHYLAYFWRSKRGREIMTSLAQGATRYNLSKAYFNKVNLIIPQTKDEQIAIVDVLNTMDDEICQLEAERDKYTLIKQGMMQELLTGKIRLV